MNMPTVAKLKDLTEEELVTKIDELSTNTVVGVNFYFEELRSRRMERYSKRMDRFTKAITWMTMLVLIVTLANVAIFAFTEFLKN